MTVALERTLALGITGYVATGAGKERRPWQEHAEGMAMAATTALRLGGRDTLLELAHVAADVAEAQAAAEAGEDAARLGHAAVLLRQAAGVIGETEGSGAAE